MNIVIFSDDTKTVDSINRILSPKGFLTRNEKACAIVFGLKKYNMAVVDLSSIKAGFSLPEVFCKTLNDAGIPVLLILSYSQSDWLYNTSLRYDDFMFLDNLSRELEVRMGVIASKKSISVPKESITIGGLSLNMDKYELTVDQNPIELTYKEYELLKLLLENQNRVFSRSKLLSVVWDYDFYGGSRTVDVHIRRLRAKLPSPYNLMLKTVRNVGYMFSPDLTLI